MQAEQYQQGDVADSVHGQLSYTPHSTESQERSDDKHYRFVAWSGDGGSGRRAKATAAAGAEGGDRQRDGLPETRRDQQLDADQCQRSGEEPRQRSRSRPDAG